MSLQDGVIKFEQEVLLSDQHPTHASECAIAIQWVEVAKTLSLVDLMDRQSLVEGKDPNALWNYLYVTGNVEFELEWFEENLYTGESFVGVAKTIVKKPTQGVMHAIEYMQKNGPIDVDTNGQTPYLNMMLITINNIRVGDKIIHDGHECIVCSIEPCEKGAKHIFSSHYIALAIDTKTKKAYAVDLRTAQKL